MTSKLRFCFKLIFLAAASALYSQFSLAGAGNCKPGQKIAWADRIYDKWAAGSFIGETPGGCQPIIQKRPGDPNSQMASKNDLGALIKKRGTAFLHNSAVSDFGQKSSAFGMTSEVTGPLGHNFAPSNTQDWLFGNWVTSKIGLSVHYVEGNKRITWTEIGGANTGKVTLNKDGTYAWNTDSVQGVIQGRWHEASIQEMAHQGGAGVVLENAKNGEARVDFQCRASNPGEEWLSLAEVNHRSIREGAMRIPEK